MENILTQYWDNEAELKRLLEREECTLKQVCQDPHRYPYPLVQQIRVKLITRQVALIELAMEQRREALSAPVVDLDKLRELNKVAQRRYKAWDDMNNELEQLKQRLLAEIAELESLECS